MLASIMGRCNKCQACAAVVVFRSQNRGQKNRKKVKSYEVKNKCTNATSVPTKRKLSEVENLFAAGHGGEIRGELCSITSTVCEPRASRPTKFNEDTSFDEKTFEEYCSLVRQCQDVASESTSSGVRLEARSMIPKLRGLLDPSIKFEVDYQEATKDGSNVLSCWRKGDAAGTSAFIPSMQSRDECYNALKIFSCAEDESKQIPVEYVETFGEDDGIYIYNALVQTIGEQDKKCLPLVNLCLRTWMDKLSEDMELWADLSPLDFNKWKDEEMKKARARGYQGRTSYEMMMAIFGSKSTPSSDTPAKSKSNKRPQKDFFMPSSSAASTGPECARVSKIQKLGEVLRAALIQASALRRRSHNERKADQAIAAALESTSEGNLNAVMMKRSREAAKKMEDILFSVGGAERIIATLRYFKDKTIMQEASRAGDMMASGDKVTYYSKDEKFATLVVNGVREFLGMFQRTRGNGDKGGGRRKLEDQNAYDAVMASLMSGGLDEAKLGRMLSRKLNVNYRQIKRGRAIRKNMHDMDERRWIRKASAVPKSAIGEGKLFIPV